MSGLVTTTILNTEASEIENKIPDISGLMTTAILSKKINEFEDKSPANSKQVTTQQFSKSTAENSAARLKQADLANQNNYLTETLNVYKFCSENLY